THKIMEYLIDNPKFRIKLFSDSTAEAKKAGRQKLVGKDGKQQQYAQLAEYVFKDDPAEMVRFASNIQKYASAVETRLRRHKEYIARCNKLGATGASLDLIDVYIPWIRESWPWWDDLHGFWRELPNYNPVGVQSSQPGTDHASAAQALYSN
ncbi:hypothetical protein C8R44DRAFT_594956, partial [Mycena epipterygia]